LSLFFFRKICGMRPLVGKSLDGPPTRQLLLTSRIARSASKRLELVSRKDLSRAQSKGSGASLRKGAKASSFADFRSYVPRRMICGFVDWNTYAPASTRLFPEAVSRRRRPAFSMRLDRCQRVDETSGTPEPSSSSPKRLAGRRSGSSALIRSDRVKIETPRSNRRPPSLALRWRAGGQERVGGWSITCRAFKPRKTTSLADGIKNFLRPQTPARGIGRCLISDMLDKQGYEEGLRYLNGAAGWILTSCRSCQRKKSSRT